MKNVTFTTQKALSRRTFLRRAGVAMALPMLDAMRPALAAAVPPPRRFVSVSLSLGLHGPNLIPKAAGRGYQPSRYLKAIDDLRDDFTVVSGVSHPGVGGGHRAEACTLTAHPNSNGSDSGNTISIDQLMAKHLGHQTRFPSLVMNTGGVNSPSYTENGVMIPAENSVARLYARLFIDDSPQEQKRHLSLIKQGRSIMDLVGGEARTLQRELGASDRDRLDSWFTSVRELEVQLEMNEGWISEPKPKVDFPKPGPVSRGDLLEIQRCMSKILHCAFQTDSTRFATLHITPGSGVLPIEGVQEGYHSLSHHGRDEEKLEQLQKIEQSLVAGWGNLLRDLKGTPEGRGTLLDETMVLLTSNLGNASSHNNKNMPVLFGGGGFNHGQHLAFDSNNNYPLPNLFLSALHRAGVTTERFATSDTEMRGLESA